MSLLNAGKVNDSDVKDGEMVAFNWAEAEALSRPCRVASWQSPPVMLNRA
jgi:hypothetical protein